jgi:hypothetical protein
MQLWNSCRGKEEIKELECRDVCETECGLKWNIGKSERI